MNYVIEKLQTIIAACTILLVVICIANACVSFLNNQNFDELLDTNNVYNFKDDLYLVEDNIVLCGVEFEPGYVIQKDLYNKCNN